MQVPPRPKGELQELTRLTDEMTHITLTEDHKRVLIRQLDDLSRFVDQRIRFRFWASLFLVVPILLGILTGIATLLNPIWKTLDPSALSAYIGVISTASAGLLALNALYRFHERYTVFRDGSMQLMDECKDFSRSSGEYEAIEKHDEAFPQFSRKFEALRKATELAHGRIQAGRFSKQPTSNQDK